MQLQKISSIWDLVDGQVSTTVPNGQSTRTVLFPSPLKEVARQRELLPKLLDYCTTQADMDLPPRINVNTASQTVLMALTSLGRLQELDVTNIIGKRPEPGAIGAEDPVWRSIAWLVTDAQLPISTVRRLDPYLTGRTQVYRFQVLGHFDKGGPTARVEAVVDTNQGRPRILYYRDISELGKGFDISPAAP